MLQNIREVASETLIYLSLMACGGNSFASDFDPESLVFWQAILPFGQEQAQSPDKAFYDLGSYLFVLDTWRAQIDLPLENKPLWTDYRSKLANSHDAENLQFIQDNALSFQGKWFDQQYQFAVVEEKIDLAGADQYGAVSGRLAFEPLSAQDENLLFDFNAQIHMGGIVFEEFLAFVETFQQLVSQDRLDATQFSQTLQHIDLGDTETSDAVDREVLAQLYTTVPLTMTSFISFIAFDDQVAFEPYQSSSATRLRIRMRVLPDQFERYFPDTYADFSDALESSSFTIKMLDDQDRLVAQIGYEEETGTFFADAALYQGALIAQTTDFQLTETLYYPTTLPKLDYKMNFSGRVRAYGLKIDIRDFVIDARYRARTAQSEASFAFQANTLPEVEVSGALLYVVPSWLIDWLIPGSIETIVMGAFNDLVGGNDGEGLVAHLSFPKLGDEQLAKIQMRGETTHKTLSRVFAEPEDNDSGKRRLYPMLRYAFRRDFADMIDVAGAESAENFQSFFRGQVAPF